MQNVEDAPRSWGGAREGAGRKRVSSKSISIRIPEDVAAVLDSVEGSKTDFIVAAIRAYAKTSGL